MFSIRKVIHTPSTFTFIQKVEQPVLHINFMKWIFNNQETSRILLNIRNDFFFFQEIRCVRISFIDNISSIQQPRTVKHGKL